MSQRLLDIVKGRGGCISSSFKECASVVHAVMGEEISTWRMYLQGLIETPEQRQAMANALNVQGKTLERWASGESIRPRPALIRELINYLPKQEADQFLTLFLADSEVAQEEYRSFLRTPSSFSEQEDIPPVVYDRVLAAIANESDLKFRTILDLVLHHAPPMLDPNRLGLTLLVVQCTPPSQQKVRSLILRAGKNSTEALEFVAGRFYFLGLESLCGYCVTTCTSRVIHDRSSAQNRLPVRSGDEGGALQFSASLAVVPIHRSGSCVAGCLLATSSQINYFHDKRLELLRRFANLLMLAFEPGNFYRVDDIALEIMPSTICQQSYFDNFVTRVLLLIQQARKEGKEMSYVEAESLLLSQIETQLIEAGSRGGVS